MGEISQIIVGLAAIGAVLFAFRLDKKEKRQQTIDYAKTLAKNEKLEAEKNAAIETKKTRKELGSLSADELAKRMRDNRNR